MTNLLNDLVGSTSLVCELPSWSIRLLVPCCHIHLVTYVKILLSSVAVCLLTLPFLDFRGIPLRFLPDLLQLARVSAHFVGSGVYRSRGNLA